MVYLLAAPGFEESEAIVPMDLLRRAQVPVSLVSLSGDEVVSSHQVTMKADCELDQVDLDQAQMIFMPGGVPGVDNLWEDARVIRLLQRAVQRDLWVAAICAAPALLGRLGFLEGRKATCYPTWQHELKGAEIPPEDRVIVDGHWITGEACGSAFHFGLKLVEVLCGREKADEIGRQICFHF